MSCIKIKIQDYSTKIRLDFIRNEFNGNENNLADIIFYSDNCSGQNKNKFIACLYLYASLVLNIYTIRHKFLIVGHTQNEGDSMHSVIEGQKKNWYSEVARSMYHLNGYQLLSQQNKRKTIHCKRNVY